MVGSCNELKHESRGIRYYDSRDHWTTLARTDYTTQEGPR